MSYSICDGTMIDFRVGVIQVLRRTKNGKPRHIPLNGRLREVFKRVPRNLGSDLIFCRSDGKAWVDIRESSTAALQRAGIEKHVTFHTLRHTFASHLVMAGVDLYTVSELLGHSSIEMTQRYAHLSPDHKRMVMDRLERYFQEKGTADAIQAQASPGE